MSRRIALITLSLALLPYGLSAQRVAPDSASVAFRPQAMGLAILGGVAGSAVGFTAGLGAGGIGALVGSIFGSTMGANYMARKGGADPSLRTSLGAATVGLFTGFLGVMAAAQINDSSAVVLVLGFSLGQGLLTGNLAGTR